VDENDYRYEDADAGEYEGSAGEPRPRTQARHVNNMDNTGYAPTQDGYALAPHEQDAGYAAPAERDVRPTGSFPRQGSYVHPSRPRKTQPTISEPQNTKYPSDYTHDSGIAIGGGGPLSGASYRRSRSEMKRLQRDLHYGQYLEIPKGRRSIFASQERARRTKSVIALAVVAAILAIAAICVFQLLVSNFGM
jgi:hypothetical protein